MWQLNYKILIFFPMYFRCIFPMEIFSGYFLHRRRFMELLFQWVGGPTGSQWLDGMWMLNRVNRDIIILLQDFENKICTYKWKTTTTISLEENKKFLHISKEMKKTDWKTNFFRNVEKIFQVSQQELRKHIA